jgi:hypothetical protein
VGFKGGIGDVPSPTLASENHGQVLSYSSISAPNMAESPWKNDDFLPLDKVERLPKPVLIARYLDDKIISSD